MSEWQPIETAPQGFMDEILGWDGCDRAVFHRANFTATHPWRVNGDYDDYHGQPTHWMPLPEPPK